MSSEDTEIAGNAIISIYTYTRHTSQLTRITGRDYPHLRFCQGSRGYYHRKYHTTYR